MKKYTVEMWYNYHTGIEVEAESPEDAWRQVQSMPFKDIIEGFSVSDLDFDTYDVYDEEGECVL